MKEAEPLSATKSVTCLNYLRSAVKVVLLSSYTRQEYMLRNPDTSSSSNKSSSVRTENILGRKKLGCTPEIPTKKHVKRKITLLWGSIGRPPERRRVPFRAGSMSLHHISQLQVSHISMAVEVKGLIKQELI
jgi:hypothetical protein